MNIRWYKPRLLVFVLACAVHLLMIGNAFWQDGYAPYSSDQPRYVFYGESIREGRGLHAPGYENKPTAYVMPTLPLMIAAIGTDSLVRIRLVQLVLCGLVAVLTFHIAVTVFERHAIGWIAVALLLANFDWVIQPHYILTEPLFTLFTLAAIGLMVYQPERWRHMLGIGFFLGMAWLTRGALIGSLALLYPYLWWRIGFRKVVVVGIVMTLTILPWIIRNYGAFDSFVPGSTQSGNVLAGAYNDLIYQDPWGDGWINPDLLYADQVSEELFNDEIGYSNYQYERGVEWIQANPGKLPKLWAAHVFGFVRPWLIITRTDLEYGYQLASWLAAMGLLGFGAWHTVRYRVQSLAVMWLVILGGFLTGLIFFAIPRYRLPYAPYFALIQAVAVWQIYQRLPRSDQYRLFKPKSDTATAE